MSKIFEVQRKAQEKIVQDFIEILELVYEYQVWYLWNKYLQWGFKP